MDTKFEWLVVLQAQNYPTVYEVKAQRSLYRAVPLLAAALMVVAFSNFLQWYVNLAAAACAITLLLWYVFSPGVRGLRLWRRSDNTPTTLYFKDDCIQITVRESSYEMPYTAFRALTETETTMLLHTKKGVMILPKDSLTASTLDEFRVFMREKTLHQWRSVATNNQLRRRSVTALAGFAAAFLLVAGVRGAEYIRRPVVFSSEGTNSCTISLPRFMQEAAVDGGEQYYEGNGISVSVDFNSIKEIQAQFDYIGSKETVSLASYAAFQQEHGGAYPKGEWVKSTKNEWYMMYADGAWYVCNILHWTEDGCWQVRFHCPGERQDTYYNRFDKWRQEIEYNE